MVSDHSLVYAPDSKVRFSKYHGLGNDYLVIEPSDLSLDEAKALASRICHRNYGVGGDGILLGPLPASEAPFGLAIINPDGSEAEKSGNGLRIFARYLWDVGRVATQPFHIQTRGGVAEARVLPDAEKVRMSMGRARFDAEGVGVLGYQGDVVDAALDLDDSALTFTAVSVGNPHCVVRGAEVSEREARRLGPRIENDPRFANRTNVQLSRVIDRENLEIQIWERGAGYTLASGSSASAAACAAKRRGDCDGVVTVHMPGGQLLVEIDDEFEVVQTGPAARVATGEIARECLGKSPSWEPLDRAAREP